MGRETNAIRVQAGGFKSSLCSSHPCLHMAIIAFSGGGP